jgi:hypothetical protein
LKDRNDLLIVIDLKSGSLGDRFHAVEIDNIAAPGCPVPPMPLMAGALQLPRSTDLIWSRITRDYLVGEGAPPNDLMACNADVTRPSYRIHFRASAPAVPVQ